MKKVLLAVVAGLVINFVLGQWFDSKPVARVRYKHPVHVAGFSKDFLWCDILSVSDSDEFPRVCEKISDDGKRANMYGEADDLVSGRSYYVYKTGSALGGYRATLEEDERSYFWTNIIRFVVCSILSLLGLKYCRKL